MTATVATRLWQDHIWIGFVLILATVAAWAPEVARSRARRWWFAYVAGIFVYTLLRSYADETLIPTQTDYVIRADQLVFFGTDPVVWLQERLFGRWGEADLVNPDFPALARAFGCRGERLADAGALPAALHAAFAASGPSVLELPLAVDPPWEM